MKIDIRRRAINSAKWSASGEVASRLISPLVVVILARILTPEDFGLVAIASIVLGLAQQFRDFGLSKTLVQREGTEDEIDRVANIVFWSNLTLSVLLYFLVFIGAPLIAAFFHNEKSVNVLRVVPLQLTIQSFFIVQSAYLQRALDFKKLFYGRLAYAFIPGIVSVPMAFLGFGVWSLVFGMLSGALAQSVVLWKSSVWRPSLGFDTKLAKGLIHFSSWVFLEAILAWLIIWGDSIALGRFLTTKDLGIYRTGYNLVLMLFVLVFSPIVPVSYAAFSRLQNNKEELKDAFLKSLKIAGFLSITVGVFLLIESRQIALLVFGEKWPGVEVVIAYIGITQSVAWLVGLNPELFRAIGRPDVNSKLLFLAALYYLPTYILVAPYGLRYFCIARLGVAIVGVGLHVYFANKLLKLGWLYLIKLFKYPVAAGILVGVFAKSIRLFGGLSVWSNFLLTGMMFVSIYFTFMLLAERSFMKQTFRLVVEVIR